MDWTVAMVEGCYQSTADLLAVGGGPGGRFWLVTE